MINIWRIYFIIFLMSFVTSCNPMGKDKLKVTVSNPKIFQDLKLAVTSVSIHNNQLVINGSGLTTINSALLKNNSQSEIFQVESASDSQIITKGIKKVSLLAGSVFDLVLSNSYASETFQVSFTMSDGSVTAVMLNSMGATAGQILKYNGSVWAPASQIDAQSFIGTWDASNSIGGEPDLSVVSSTPGDYYVVTVAGNLNGVIYAIGDWIISDGYNWNKIPLTKTSVTSFQDRKGIVTLRPSDYLSFIDETSHKITSSSLADIADIDLAANGGLINSGQVLKWNTTTLKWEPGNSISNGEVSSSDIGAGVITDTHVSSTAGIAISKIANLTADLAAKQNSSTLSTDIKLTNLTSSIGNITASDSILDAFGKLMNTQSDYVSKTGLTTISGSFNFSNPTSFLYAQTPTGTTATEVANVQYVTNAIGLNEVWAKSGSTINYTAGNVGIGTTAGTNTRLKVNGQIVGSSSSIATSAIDFSIGNSITTTFDCESNISLANIGDGGNYIIAVTGQGAAQCNFDTATSGDGAATVNYRFYPPNSLRIENTHSIYNLFRVGNIVYVSWVSGF